MFQNLLGGIFFLLTINTIIAQNPIAIPDAISGTEFNLEIAENSKSFYSGFQTNTMGVNGYNYLGPTLILNKGDFVTMNVQNNLNETTTIHWHGMHVSAKNDGGPHTTIPPATTWSPSFEVMDRAATYWYHPHLHEKTAEQVTKGIAGFIIVKDEEEEALNLPRQYGIDDFPLVLQSRAFDNSKQLIVETAMDNVMLVNGTIDPSLNVPAQVVRLRLLNGSTDRVYNLGFEGNLGFHQIATDGGCLEQPVTLTRLLLAPGERAEVLLELQDMVGNQLFLKSFASELPNGIYGAANPSAMPMGSISGYSNNDLNGNDFNILQLNITSPTPNAETTIPSDLINFTPLSVNDIDQTRALLFQPQQMGPFGMLTGPFVINGQSFDMQTINETIPLDNTEIWELTNMTAIAHPFHIHDVQFNILEIDEMPPPANLQGWKDVVLVPAMETVKFITRFSDFADTDVPYMYHCHMLTHEDAGMMGQFIVEGNLSSTADNEDLDFSIQLFPNPASETIHIISSDKQNFIEGIEIFDAFGRRLLGKQKLEKTQIDIPVLHFPQGNYYVKIKTKKRMLMKKLHIM